MKKPVRMIVSILVVAILLGALGITAFAGSSQHSFEFDFSQPNPGRTMGVKTDKTTEGNGKYCDVKVKEYHGPVTFCVRNSFIGGSNLTDARTANGTGDYKLTYNVTITTPKPVWLRGMNIGASSNTIKGYWWP